jgi:hypothetical protein
MTKHEFGCLVIRRQLGIYSGPAAGTRYDLGDACSVCGTGARQIGPLKVKAKRAIEKLDIILTLDRDVLLSARVGEELQRESSDALGPVADANGRPLPVLQLRAQETLPHFSSRTTGVLREDPCASCDRNGHFGDVGQPYRLVYESVQEAIWKNDVLATWECFGVSALRSPFSDSVIALPVHVISQRLFERLRRAGVRPIEFQPIEIL